MLWCFNSSRIANLTIWFSCSHKSEGEWHIQFLESALPSNPEMTNDSYESLGNYYRYSDDWCLYASRASTNQIERRNLKTIKFLNFAVLRPGEPWIGFIIRCRTGPLDGWSQFIKFMPRFSLILHRLLQRHCLLAVILLVGYEAIGFMELMVWI